jgi:hypothetical protein
MVDLASGSAALHVQNWISAFAAPGKSQESAPHPIRRSGAFIGR